MSSSRQEKLGQLELMILDTLLEDIEGFQDIVGQLNSANFSYLSRGGVECFSKAEVKQRVKRLFLAGYISALEQTHDGLRRRDAKEVDVGALEDYWFELTDKGRQTALRDEW